VAALVVIQRTFRQLRNGRFSPNLVTKRTSVSHRGIRKDIFKSFHFRGHLSPKFEIENRSNRHHTHSRLQITRCTAERYCYSTKASEFQRSVNFSLWRTVEELRGVKVAKFSDFGLFSLYKTPKTYLPMTSLQPRGYIAEWFRFFRVVVEGPKGCLLGPDISCDLWYGSWRPQTSPNFRLWQMAIPIHNAATRGIKSGPESEHAQFWGQMYSSTKYLCIYSPTHPQNPFWGTFQCETYYTESSPSVAR